MDVLEAIKDRHATRAFDDKAIDDQNLTAIVTDAQRTPSWGNSQPWEVYIATGKSLEQIKSRYAAAAQAGVTEAADLAKAHRGDFSTMANQNMGHWVGTFRPIIEADPTTYWDSRENLYRAPAIAYLVLGQNPNSWSIYDLGAFSQTLSLAATARGVQSLSSYELVKYPDILRQELAVPTDRTIAMGIALGYEKPDKVLNQFRTDRVATQQILHIQH
ncbi:nitroreductase [Levilactobacillus brevis]|uniref:Nitroreductase n=1 Tax=Levilactobacillus brevis TaxID=1580 RepID=A0AA41JRX6_LEVBR|nr:nitroreductase [Levilactobacillus brevis]ANN48962.1 nitrobenzoate reductase [Levilactobacillus brevis]ATU69304.1 nitrobenzoate reductase [Levilactobacillus brevis]KID44915.1 p-nitrobenzoate reductase [Levilactobacillus brevis]MBS0946246.1 nitroreductase [Levilactobacillus brevis]MBS0977704.1 nitroreductase [Levilactobacillus brevis]